MQDLTEKDFELIERASETIKKNYDSIKYNHTVAVAVRCKNGKIYTGVNVYSLHGACAEVIAIGSAITYGEREFECIVAVRGKNGYDIIGAKKVGIHSIGVLFGYGDRNELEEAGADFIVDTVAGIGKVLLA